MIIFADGFSNNKESGYTICDDTGEVLSRVVFSNRRTCNETELLGVREAINFCNDTIITDSKVVTYWVRSGQCQARPDLTPVAKEIQRLLVERKIRLEWKPREHNLAGIYNERK
jgi:ribonuclease HI